MATGRMTLKLYFNHKRRLAEIWTGKLELTENDLFTPPSVQLVHSIQDAFGEAGVRDSDIWPKTIEYLTSPSLKYVPHIKVRSMLYAALARKAAAGRKRPPDQGMVNDIEIVSVLLPYCDAMFIDKECHSYLSERPLSEKIDYGTKVFSLNNKAEFLEYLKELEKRASREHLKKVAEVYGVTWREPYTTLYGK